MSTWNSSKVWHSVDESPSLYVGDRLVIIVHECPYHGAKPRHELVIIQAEENGWSSPDPTFSSYGPTDGVAWAYEGEVLELAKHEGAI